MSLILLVVLNADAAIYFKMKITLGKQNDCNQLFICMEKKNFTEKQDSIKQKVFNSKKLFQSSKYL